MTKNKKKWERLDKYLVSKGLIESREMARRIILAGKVKVAGKIADKAGTLIGEDEEINIDLSDLRFVSRGGFKLEYALERFKLDVNGLVAADIGASTGGFTDCLLQRGATRVYAIDVGYGQFHWKLRNDPRVILMERFNARYLTETDLPEQVDLVVMDVSFI